MNTTTTSTSTISSILLDSDSSLVVNPNISQQELVRIGQAKQSIDLQKDSFGSEVQNKISDFGKSYLQEIKVGQSGEVQNILLDVKSKIRSVGDIIPTSKPSIIQKVFRLGSNQINKFVDKQKSVDTFLQTVETTIKQQALTLTQGITHLEQLYLQVKENYKSLCIFIAAGIQKVEEERSTTLEQLRLKAEETKSVEDSQNYNEYKQKIEAFEQRLHNLKISRMICLQQFPQIRATQTNHRKTVDNLQQVVTQLLPSWRSNIILLIQQYEGRKAVEMEQNLRDATEQLLLKNSELLRTNTVETVRLATTNHIKIETIKTIQTNLFAMIDETVQIQEEAKERRKKEAEELLQLEESLKTKMLTGRKG